VCCLALRCLRLHLLASGSLLAAWFEARVSGGEGNRCRLRVCIYVHILWHQHTRVDAHIDSRGQVTAEACRRHHTATPHGLSAGRHSTQTTEAYWARVRNDKLMADGEICLLPPRDTSPSPQHHQDNSARGHSHQRPAAHYRLHSTHPPAHGSLSRPHHTTRDARTIRTSKTSHSTQSQSLSLRVSICTYMYMRLIFVYLYIQSINQRSSQSHTRAKEKPHPSIYIL